MEISDFTAAHKDTGMNEKIRILFISANPWTTSRILVDEEEREVFERLQEGPCRDSFELHKHAATRSIDMQRLLMMYKPHIVHFSGHASKTQKIILGSTRGARGKEVDREGLVQVLGLYKNHVRLVLLNACFTRTQALSLSEVIDYTVGSGKGLGDKGGVAFAGAFYRALGFGKSVKDSFASAKAELCLTKMPRTKGIELFVRDGIHESDPFPQAETDRNRETAAPWKFLSNIFAGQSGPDLVQYAGALLQETSVLGNPESYSSQIPVFETSSISLSRNLIRYREESHSCGPMDEHVSRLRRETAAPVLGVVARDNKNPPSGFTRLRKAKGVTRSNPRPTKDEIEPRSSTHCLRDFVALTISVQRVLLMAVTGALNRKSYNEINPVRPARG